jgi:tetratricopeptide (TPR) repeat protein
LYGCSYSTNVTRVSEVELANYNPKHFATPKRRTGVSNENDLIVKAIFYENQGNFKKSNHFYKILFEKTNDIEYMFRELTTALYAGVESKNILKLEEWIRNNPDDIQSKRLLISFYINKKSIQKAKKIGQELISKSGKAIDYELSASPYILSGKYREAVKLLSEAYKKNFNEDILIKITTILANYIGNTNLATQYLETHRDKRGCSEKVCNQLIEIYTKSQKVYPLILVYHSLYKETKKDIYAVKVVEGYIYTENFDKAIEFLQKEYDNDELLYELYLAKKDYISALEIANKLFISQNRAKWLAESAMALYESAKNKNDQKMLAEVVDKFEKAISAGVQDSVYLNYYGYTLIDKDIDIEKGVKIVKDALKEQPNNSYYLDSLAWGYYKLNLCKEAYIEMKKVVEIEGLDEEDIAQHWISIQECNR